MTPAATAAGAARSQHLRVAHARAWSMTVIPAVPLTVRTARVFSSTLVCYVPELKDAPTKASPYAFFGNTWGGLLR